MKSCAVLGNGPGLGVVGQWTIPVDAFLIGVNRSYKVIWSPIICATDGDAAREAYAGSRALSFFVKRGALPIGMPGVAVFDPPQWAYNAGAFGIWIAAQMCFDRIHLVGFGGEGHFSDDGTEADDRSYYRPSIETAIEFAKARGAEIVHTVEVMA